MQEITAFISNHPVLSIIAVIVFILVVIVELMRTKQSNVRIAPAQATQFINHDNAVVIDIRPQDAYRKGHIIDAVSLSQQDMKDTPKKLEKYKIKPIILVCATGVESQKIATLLLKRGYNAYSLAGGMRAWDQADMPLVKE